MKTLLWALLALCLTGCGGGGGTKNPGYSQKSGWQIVTVQFPGDIQQFYSLSSYPQGAGTTADGGLWLNLPSYTTAEQAAVSPNVNRLWYLYPTHGSLTGQSNITYSFNTTATGNPSFFWQTEPVNNCTGTPAGVHPMFVAFYTGAFVPTVEWWSNPYYYPLGTNTQSLQIPISPNSWSDEQGHFANSSDASLAAFNSAMGNINTLGVSFGGGCFTGHGVSVVGGTARIEIHISPSVN